MWDILQDRLSPGIPPESGGACRHSKDSYRYTVLPLWVCEDAVRIAKCRPDISTHHQWSHSRFKLRLCLPRRPLGRQFVTDPARGAPACSFRLTRLDEHVLVMNPKTSVLAVTTIEFLGHLVSLQKHKAIRRKNYRHSKLSAAHVSKETPWLHGATKFSSSIHTEMCRTDQATEWST